MPKSTPQPIPNTTTPSHPPSLTSSLPLPPSSHPHLPPLKPLSSTTTPPYTHAARDKHGEDFSFYPSVPALLSALHAHPDTTVAAASRTHAPELAREMLRLLQIPAFALPAPPPAATSDTSSPKKSKTKSKAAASEKPRKAIEFFNHLEIYPGSKKKHFARLREVTGVEYGDMLFFDDEKRNREVESLGVTMWWVPDGLDGGEFEKGVLEWRRRRGKGKGGEAEEK